MGLFDFMKDVGEQIFGKGKEERAALRDLIEQSLQSKIENLTVEYQDGTVTLAGQAPSQAEKEKAVLLAGNVKGVEKVNADALTVNAPLQTQSSSSQGLSQQVEFYTIEKGDTLSAIAKKHYGDASKYHDIFNANREVIKDADKIYPGQKIRLPQHAAS